MAQDSVADQENNVLATTSSAKVEEQPISISDTNGDAGPNGHLSNEAAGKTVSYLLNSGLKNVMLGHLSKENNFPELAYKTVIDELCASNFDENKIKIAVASRSNPSEILNLEVS